MTVWSACLVLFLLIGGTSKRVPVIYIFQWEYLVLVIYIFQFCTPNQYSYPCQTYAYYQATALNFLDLASIGDLFSLSHLKISEPSNIYILPFPTLIAGQPLFVPLSCSCNYINATTGTNFSYANLSYIIKPNDTFYIVSTFSIVSIRSTIY